MGTKNSYKGAGGPDAKKLRDSIDEWLDTLPTPPPTQAGNRTTIPPLTPQQLAPVIGLFRSSGGGGGADGPGGGGAGGGSGGSGGASRRSGGPRRTSTRSASTAGRAAAAAYALATGDAAALQEFGLDYESLRNNPDLIDVTQQIVAAACGPLPDGTIEDDERRVVAAQVAQWILEQSAEGAAPTPAETVRETIACILFEAISTETAARLHEGDRPAWASAEAERQIRDTAQALALRADLPPTNPTAAEFTAAIEHGIETMRAIWGTS